MISLTIKGIKAKAMTNPQSCKLRLWTLNAFAKTGIEITPNCKMNPTMIAPIRYILENRPICNMDFVEFLIDNE